MTRFATAPPPAAAPSAQPAMPDAADEVEVDMEAMRGFCNGRLLELYDAAVALSYSRPSGGLELFGASDAGRAMSQSHRAALESAQAAMRGFATDIEGFQDKLRHNLKAYKDADDAAAERLQRLTSMKLAQEFLVTEYEGDRAFREAAAARAGGGEAVPAPDQQPETGNEGTSF